MENPDGTMTGGRSLFVDRVSESEALKTALLQHRMRIDRNLVDAKSLRNVLTFYGDGGVGKTELSRQLAQWIVGESSGVEHWGRPPDTVVDETLRWEFNDSHGGLDPLTLLIVLRSHLGSIKESWPAFDLAFGALFRTLRPGMELELRSHKSGSTTLSSVLAGLFTDVVTGFDLTASGGIGAAGFGLGRSLLASAHAKSVARRTLNAYPTLERLIEECESASGSVEETALLAGRVAFMLTEQVDRFEPSERPMVVIFADHMERLQLPGQLHLGEATLNRLIARLPYFLFVVTGRKSLRWHEPTAELVASGSHTWPLLSTEHPPGDEPSQHMIGNLAVEDAEQFLRSSFEMYAVSVVPDLVESLASTTGGWPLHLQTIVGVANGRSKSGQPLTAADLGGSFPALVERFLSDLPSEVAEAFRAACLLPYFDIDFVAAAGEVRHGAVEQLVRRQVVRPNEDSVYPYRIHDALRKSVRDAGSDAVGGWGIGDWKRHAILALAEAERRFEQAMTDDDDRAAIHSLALGLNVATEHSVFEPWLVDAIRRSPSIQGLSSLIAAQPEVGASPDLSSIFHFLRLRVNASVDDVTDQLGEIVAGQTAISSTAGIWRAYDLRNRGRIDQALTQFEALLNNFNDRPDLYRNQIVTTLRLDRRFGDALDRSEDLLGVQKRMQRGSIDRAHGKFAGASASFEERITGATSRRFQVELSGDWLVMRHREHGVTEGDALAVHEMAVVAGHPLAQVDSAAVLAQTRLFDDEVFADCTMELQELSSRRFQPFPALPLTIALRAWATNDHESARRAHQVAALAVYRNSSWVPTEILLEHLGYPLAPIARTAQWLEPYDVVKTRWLGILRDIVERARPTANPSQR